METKFFISGLIAFIAVVIVFIILLKWFSKSNFLRGKDDTRLIVSALFSLMLPLVISAALMGVQGYFNITENHDQAMFDEKIVVYRDFLCDLDTILHDKKISKEEEYELQIKLSYLSLHIHEPENMMKISKAIADIVMKIKNEHNDDKGIMIELIEITDVMYNELYGEEITTKSKKQTLADIRDEMVLEFYSINVPSEDMTSYLYVVKRIREIKKLMAQKQEENKVLYDKQWVYNGYTLVHDLYTDKDKYSGKFVCNERPHKYAVDLKFNTKGDTVSIEVFSRKNSPKETNELLKKLGAKTLKPSYFEAYFKDSINSIMENGHYEYARWDSQKMGNDTIAKELVELLNAINQCRK